MAKLTNKRELGLGVRALLSNIETQTKDRQQEVVRELTHSVAMIPLAEIEVNPFQPRKDFDPEALKDLSDSLRVHGLIQPITVRRLTDRQYQLISGERRFRASRMAGLTEVPAYVRLANDQEMIEMALVENIQRADLNAIEIAITYQRLLEECELTHDRLSDRVGKARETVTNYLRLLKLPVEIQQGLKQGLISMGHARAIIGLEDYLLQARVYKEVTEKGLSVRATEDLVRSYREPARKKAAGPRLGADYQQVEDTLKRFFDTKVQLKVKSNGSGLITIPFGSSEDLNRLLDLLEQ